MGRRLSFDEFSKAMNERRMPMAALEQYLEFDNESPVPKLVFRPDALIDTPDPGYDVDEAVYRLQRLLEEEANEQADIFYIAPRKCIMAEGDSWINLPGFLWPRAIGNWIWHRQRFEIKNLARWGHTLEKIIKQAEWRKHIPELNPDYFLLCGGGNDIQIGIEQKLYLHPYKAGTPYNQYITPEGAAALEKIEEGLRSIISDASKISSSLTTLVHGYDYPRPLVRGGQYIGRHLRDLGFPPEEMTPLVKSLMGVLNTHVEKATIGNSKALYINCLGSTDNYTWFDDMHPGNDGFEALSLKFEDLFV